MAKYDHGGGCACGLQKVCDCEHATVPLTPKKEKPRARITDAMVKAAVMVYHDQAVKDGHVPASEDDAPEMWDRMYSVTRKALEAARDAI